MNNTIKCPYCKKTIEITSALSHEIDEKTKLNLENKIKTKFKEEYNLKLKDKENETGELIERNKELSNQQLELNRLIRSLKENDEKRALEMEKLIGIEKDKAKLDAIKKASEEYRHKEMEKDKTINDLKKLLDDARRKSEQGSQQTQGEILELDLENELRNAFRNDDIIEVKKGTKGADIVQVVKTPLGNSTGKIIWELKRTKRFDQNFIDKLKSDQRTEKAELAVLITTMMPKDCQKDIISVNNVWIATPKHTISLANILRQQLLAVAKQKAISSKTQTDAQILFDYMTSSEFSHQLEAIIETYLSLQNQINKEKMAFEKQWKQREKELEKMYKSLFGIYGSLIGIAGNSLPQIKGIEMLDIGEE